MQDNNLQGVIFDAAPEIRFKEVHRTQKLLVKARRALKRKTPSNRINIIKYTVNRNNLDHL